jgi:hypothetical protein
MPTPADSAPPTENAAPGGGGHADAPVAPPIHALCLHCNYSLRQLTVARCPECGQSFDPADPLTMRDPTQPGGFELWARRRATRVGRPCRWIWPATLVATAWVATMSISSLGSVTVPLFLLSLAFVAIGMPYAFRQAIRAYLVARGHLPAEILAVDRLRVRKARCAFVLTALAVAIRAPLYVGFFVSLPALDRSARYEWNVRPDGDPRPESMWIGVIRIHRITTDGNGVNFITGDTMSISYQPENRDRHPAIHLYGDWYANPSLR